VLRHRPAPPVAPPPAEAASTPETPASPDALATNVECLVEEWRASRKALDVASALQKEEQLGAAATRLEKLLQQGVKFNPVRLQLAEIYFQQKRFTESAQAALKVLSTEPDRLPARILLARSLLSSKQWEAALAAAKWALADDPYNTDAHDIAARAYIGMQQPGWALPHLRKLATLLRDDPGISGRLAETYMMLGEYQQAASILSDMLQNDRPDSTTYYHLAVCLARSGEPHQAAEILVRAAERFGSGFVSAWLHTDDLSAVRNDPLVRRFLQPTVGSTTNQGTVSGRPAPANAGQETSAGRGSP